MSKIGVPEEVRTFSIRVPESLYSEARRIAGNKKVSVNTLVSEALSKVVKETHDQEMYDAATLLGMDAEMSSVEFSVGAQAEVALANE